MLIMRIGYRALNFAMLGVTIAYILFFVFKIFYINRIDHKKKIRKITKIVYKYTKFAMRFVNAAFVVVSLFNARQSENNLVAIVGIVVLLITFVFSVLWDVCIRIVKRKLRELLAGWNALDGKEKKDKIDFYLEGLINSLDNISGLEEYVEVGKNAGRMVGEKLNLVETKQVAT